MRIAYIGDKRIPIDEYQDDMSGNITCADGHKVVAKRGNIRVHHYSHLNSCSCGSGDMSSWHIEFQDRARKECQEVRLMDKETGKCTHIADTLIPSSALDYMISDGCKGYAIEYQHSPMNMDVIRERERFYTGLGYHLVWVFDTSNWSYTLISKGEKEITIRRKQGARFPMDGAYTGNVSKILDMGRKQMLLVTKQSGPSITGVPIDMITFDKKYLGSMAVESDERPFRVDLWK